MNKTTYGTTLTAVLLAGCMGTPLEDELDASDTFTDDSEAPAAAGELDGQGPAAQPVIGPAVACVGAPIIGILDNPGDPCKFMGLPATWEAERLFAEGNDDLDGLATPVPSSLAGYCLYTRKVKPLVAAHYDDLFAAIDSTPSMPLSSTAADCLGMLPQSDLYDPSVGQGINQAFVDNVDLVTNADLGPTSAHRSPVELMIIDTASHVAATSFVNPNNFHGLQISQLARQILCPPGSPGCMSNLQHVVGLPRISWDDPANYLHGGEYGTQADLARAIYAKVTQWREDYTSDPEGAPQRLILNLSVGWDRDVGETNSPSRGPRGAFEDALTYASCQGALVIAAAGNNPTPDCPSAVTGPTDPGGFETFPAPNSAECAALGYVGTETLGRPIFGGSAPYKPLVYAVGGLDGHDQPLVNSRELGQPRLAAYATFGTAGSGPSGEALTGTSISAAVASSTAALLWSYRPELRPSEVMEFIYQTGLATGPSADFVGVGATDTQVRRISVCAALSQACASEDPTQCPHLGCSAPTPGVHGNQDDFFSATEAVLLDPGTTINSYDPQLAGGAPDCSIPYDFSALAEPQPEIPVCSHCSVDIPPELATSTPGDDTVIIGIDPSYDGLIGTIKLTTYDATRTASSFDLSSYAPYVSSTTVTTVTVHAPDTNKAYLEFTINHSDGTTSTQSNAVTVNHTGAALLP